MWILSFQPSFGKVLFAKSRNMKYHAVAFFFTLLSLTAQAQVPVGSVHVTVLDDDEPLIGAVVTISQDGNYVASNCTDILGECRITDLELGVYDLTVEYLRKKETASVKIVNGKTIWKNIFFEFETTCWFHAYEPTMPSLHDSYGGSVSVPGYLLQTLMP